MKRNNRWSLVPIWSARIVGVLWCVFALGNLLEGGLGVKACGCLGIALVNFTVATIAVRMRKIGIARQESGSKGRRLSGWAVVWWIVAIGYAMLSIVELSIGAFRGEIALIPLMMQGAFALSMAFGAPICLAMIANDSKAMMKKMMVICMCVAMGAIAGCRYAPSESVSPAGRQYCAGPEKADDVQGGIRPSEAQLDIEMLALKTAYDNERKRLDLACANELTHWGFIMKRNKEEALREKYWRIASARLQETASGDEWRLISEYAPEIDEVLTTRARLREKIEIWNRVRNAHGVFAGQDIRFENGVAEFKDRSCDWAEALRNSEYKDGFPMKVRIDRNLVWTSHGTDYVLAHSDCAVIIDREIKGVCVYGETDSSRSTWFLRFKDGALIDTCDLGNEYWDEDSQLFCFEPRNNRLEILSVSKGKLVKELFLALWDYGKYPDGSHHFGTNKEPITDSAHDCAKLSGVHLE